MFDSTSKILTTHKRKAYAMEVKIKNLIPVFIKSIWYARCSSDESSGSGHPAKGSDISLLHNLVNTLAAKVVRICNFAKRHSIAAHLNNFRISVVIRRGPWLQWTPSPTWELLQRFGFFHRKNALLVALPHITHPSPEVNLLSVHDFHMHGWDTGVPRTLSKLGQRFCIKFESGVVIHGRTI